MCGIYGVLQLDGQPVSPDLLARMGRLTVHRGPDDEGVHLDGACAIGMRRLSIIDVAGGHQPLSNEDGTLWLVCNGEIYNFRELRRQPRGERPPLQDRLRLRDADPPLRRARRRVRRAAERHVRLRALGRAAGAGSSSAATASASSRSTCTTTASASSSRARRRRSSRCPGVAPELDPAALQSYLQLGYVPAPQSIFRGIEKLPPASLLVVENGRERCQALLDACPRRSIAR